MLFLLLLLWFLLACWKLLVLVRFFMFVLRLYHVGYWPTIAAAAARSKMAQGSRRCGRRSCLQLVEHFVDLPLLSNCTDLARPAGR